MNIVIKKQISLDYLGDEYKDSSLTFKTISIREYEELLPKIDQTDQDNKKSIEIIMDILKKQFLSGTFQGEAVAKDDLDQFDISSLTKFFMALTGQEDPKV
jgi:hypothetical protein